MSIADRISSEAYDIASVRAATNEAANPGGSSVNLVGVGGAVPSNLTAPSSLVLVGFLVTAKRTGAFLINFSLGYAITGAGTATFVVQLVPTATAIAGGSTSVGVGTHIENGGTAVSITGGTPATVITVPKTASAAASTDFAYSFPLNGVTVGDTVGVQLLVSSAVNLQTMVLSCYACEQS